MPLGMGHDQNLTGLGGEIIGLHPGPPGLGLSLSPGFQARFPDRHQGHRSGLPLDQMFQHTVTPSSKALALSMAKAKEVGKTRLRAGWADAMIPFSSPGSSP